MRQGNFASAAFPALPSALRDTSAMANRQSGN
jgi:hypothetical protein